MTFMQSMKTCFYSRYGDFSGRAARSEYGYFMLIAVPAWLFFMIALGIVATPQAAMLGGAPRTSFGQLGFFMVPGFLLLLGLATVVPTLAVTARRLHDLNASGWWQLAVGAFGIGSTDPAIDEIASVIAFLFILALAAIPGKKGGNHYGPDPKATGPWNA